MTDFLNFRKMITPTIIQIIFIVWVAVIWLATIATTIVIMSQGGMAIIGGLLYFVIAGAVGTLFARIFCELIIVVFQIHSELVGIRSGTPMPAQGFPVQGVGPIPPPPGGAGGSQAM